MKHATHLNVPTPPASRIREVSVNGLPVQRMANARRICPCATTRTSPFGASGFSRLGRWYFSLISAMRASRRRTTSSGDLANSVSSAPTSTTWRHNQIMAQNPNTTPKHLPPNPYKIRHSLSTGTPLHPNIPSPKPPLLSQRLNLLTRQPLVLPIIPLPDRLRNLHLGLRTDRLLGLSLPRLGPGEPLFAAEFEQFQGSLRAGAGGDVAVSTDANGLVLRFI